jgi:hypothetical protein
MAETSFIPKKTIPKTAEKGGTISFFLLISVIIFITSIAILGGTFLYKGFLVKGLEESASILEKEKGGFKPALIEELTRLDARIESTKIVLNKHLNLPALFEFLEENTLKSIQFETFDYIFKSEDSITINTKGIARNYASVALQSDIFGDSKYIQNPIFSKLNVNRQGSVTFNFTASIDSRLITSQE